MQQPSVLTNDELETAAAALLRQTGRPGAFSLHQLPGGANNRVFRVDIDGTRTLLKAYFQHPEDKRDRLGAEYGFCTFAWESGLRNVPKPLARDSENRLGLYEFIEGRKLLLDEVDEGAIRQALVFLADVNPPRQVPAAQKLPTASEAYFTLAEHLACIERRLQILHGIEPSAEIDREAAAFVQEELLPTWKSVRGWVAKESAHLGLGLETELAREDRRLSPSDFGFHNALLTGDGRLRFFDFEYAGWDDFAKTVSDFFCQVAVPISASYLDLVVETLASSLSEPEQFRGRVAMLLPVYRVKWCCIVLNEFVRVSSSRRRFAGAGNDLEDKKVTQLRKARRILQHLTDERDT